jgi:hypothetical protein
VPGETAPSKSEANNTATSMSPITILRSRLCVPDGHVGPGLRVGRGLGAQHPSSGQGFTGFVAPRLRRSKGRLWVGPGLAGATRQDVSADELVYVCLHALPAAGQAGAAERVSSWCAWFLTVSVARPLRRATWAPPQTRQPQSVSVSRWRASTILLRRYVEESEPWSVDTRMDRARRGADARWWHSIA